MAANGTERFALYDEDGIFLASPGDELTILEPIGFREFIRNLERDEKYRGFNVEFGEAESPLSFPWLKAPSQSYSPHEMLRDILNEVGTDANVTLRYYRGDPDVLNYEWALIFNSAEEIDSVINFRVKKTDFGEKLKTRFSVPIDLESATDLDNNANTALTLDSMALHSQRVDQYVRHQNIWSDSVGWDMFSQGTTSTSYITVPLNPDIVISGIEGYIPAQGVQFSSPPFSAPIIRESKYFGVIDLVLSAAAIWFKDADPSNFTATLGLYMATAYEGDDEMTEFLIAEETNSGFSDEHEVSVSLAPGFAEAVEFSFEVLKDQNVYMYYKLEYTTDDVFSVPPETATISMDTGGETIEGQFIMQFKTFNNPSTANGAFILDALDKAIEKATGQVGSPTLASSLLTMYEFALSDSITSSGGADGTISTISTDKLSFYVVLNNGLLSVGEQITAANATGVISEIFQVDIFIISGSGALGISDTVEGVTSGAIAELLNIRVKGAYTYYLFDVISGVFIKGEGLDVNSNPTSLVIDNFAQYVYLEEFTIGTSITGLTSGSTGTITNINWPLISVSGNQSFDVDEDIDDGTARGAVSSIVEITENKIVYSSLLERIEDGGTEDGYAALNFITSGKKIRGLTTNSNLTIGIDKILDFLKARYNAGWMVINNNGSKIVRVERASYFFQDVKIMTLYNLENPVRRKISQDFQYNEVESGYSKYAKENEDGSIDGFNTKKSQLLPIEKIEKKLSLVAPVVADGSEIERVRRLDIKPGESDQSDDEIIIIKCQRYNIDTRFLLLSAPSDNAYIEVNDAGNEIVIHGFYLKDRLAGAGNFSYYVETSFVLPVETYEQTVSISSIEYNAEDNTTTINTSTAIDAPDDDYFVGNFYFDIDVIVPETSEPFNNVSGLTDKDSTYNIDHAPSNFLIQHWNLLGSALYQKAGTKEVRFNSGVNNTALTKAYDSNEGSFTTSIISENQNFLLSSLNTYNPAIMRPFEWEVTCFLSYDDWQTLRLALLGEDGTGLNFGYVDFYDDFNNQIAIFIKSIKRNDTTNETIIVGWERETPPPITTNYILQETGDIILQENSDNIITQ